MIEIFQAGSSQYHKRLRVTNVIAHGPGIKLVNGLAQASTNGGTIYIYRCRGRFFNTRHSPGLVPSPLGADEERRAVMLKFLTVLRWPASWRYS